MPAHDERGGTAQRKLMVAYRCQYEPCNLAAVNLLRSGELGTVRVVVGDIGRAANLEDPADQWRLNKALAGGGSLMDIGSRCSRPKGSLVLDPATTYYEHSVRVKTDKGERKLEIHERDQFAEEMDYFSAAVRENRDIKSPGEEGLQDVRLMHAIYESARLGKPVKID